MRTFYGEGVYLLEFIDGVGMAAHRLDHGDARTEKPGVQVDVHPVGLLTVAPAPSPEVVARVL